MKSVTHKPRHLPTKSLLALSLLMAYGSGFAGTTITTVPVGTTWLTMGNYYLGNTQAEIDTLNVIGVGTARRVIANNYSSWCSTPWGTYYACNTSTPGTIIVGSSGIGILNIENGGVVSSDFSHVAVNAGGTGVVKVTGAGSQWKNSASLNIGVSGSGNLNIENSGVVSNVDSTLGGNPGSNGVVKVTGVGSQWNNSGSLYVGQSGHGTVNIENSGSVSFSSGFIGNQAGSNSVVTVTGAGSRLTSLGLQFVVGVSGSGALNIANAGVVSNASGFIGGNSGSTGVVKVTGAGSQWSNSSDLYVGMQGTGTLNVLDAGKVTASALSIGARGNVNLDGGTLQVGSGAIASGGVFNWASGTLGFTGNATVGSGLLASTTTLGTGKTLNVANNLTVGSGSTLQTTGGTLSAGTLTLDGGTFETGGTTTTGGLFNWLKGTLSLTGDASVGSGVLASTTTLGTGKTLNVANNLTVGESNQARILNIENGGVASNYFGYVGHTAGSSGTVTVTGAGSQWNNSGRLYVGNSGTGTLNIGNGGVVSSNAVFSSVGYNTGSQGVVNVNGAGSQWNNSGQLYVGVSGTGTLNIENGGVVSDARGTVGYLSGSSGVVNVTGAGSQWNTGGLTIGDLGNGNLSIENGGVVSNRIGVIGNDTDSMGVVKVTGAGSQWINSLTLSVGSYGSGTLNVLDSGKVMTTALNIGTKGTVNLDGGSLQVGSGSIAAGGGFNWTNGTLGYTGNASVGSGLLGSTTTLGTGKTLNVANNLTIGSGNTVALAGGQFSANTLTLSGGSITSTGAVDLTNTGTLTGHGTVAGNVTGGAANTITASGGALNLGNVSANGGYTFGGTLNVGSQQVNLLSADKAQLGVATNLGAGGTLSTLNGANLANGNTVSFNGDSNIQGNFTNNGSVVGSAGTLSFVNDVNGAGSYTGNIAFKAAFNPGNSPASVNFNGGNVTFASTSVLTMELMGSTPGTQYDQLFGISSLSFNGKLNLVFADGYVPLTGSSFALFGFNSFNGSFGAAENGYASITVSGYDRAKLDFSHLATDGTLRLTSVAAVPEPESYAMLLAGLALMGTMARRRRQTMVV